MDQPRPKRKVEKGHLMAGLMAMVAIMMILSTIAFQAWSDVLRRDAEAEMMFRAQDLVRAIQRFRRDHGGQGPIKLEDLMEPGPRGQYYLRRLWTDPLVKDGKWGLLYMGPGGQIVDPSAQPVDGGLGGGFAGGTAGSEARSGTGFTGSSGGSDRPFGEPERPGALTPAVPGSGGTPTTAVGGEVTGLPIAGVKSLSKDKPFRVYNGLTEYSQWLFTYLDLEQRLQGQQQGQQGAGKRVLGKAPGFRKGAGGPLGKRP